MNDGSDPTIGLRTTIICSIFSNDSIKFGFSLSELLFKSLFGFVVDFDSSSKYRLTLSLSAASLLVLFVVGNFDFPGVFECFNFRLTFTRSGRSICDCSI